MALFSGGKHDQQFSGQHKINRPLIERRANQAGKAARPARGTGHQIFDCHSSQQGIRLSPVFAGLAKAVLYHHQDGSVRELHALHSTVEVLDLRPVLRKAGEREPVFYKIDTHWNLMGGFIAYEAVLSKLSGQIPGLVPVAPTNF